MSDPRKTDSCTGRERFEEEVDRLFEAADALMDSRETAPETEGATETTRFRAMLKRVAAASLVWRMLEEDRSATEGDAASGEGSEPTPGEARAATTCPEDHAQEPRPRSARRTRH